MEHMVASVKRTFPDHAPLWTNIGVAKLAFPDMLIEIQVTAHTPLKKEESK